jgi:hypothetical protein
MKILTRRDWIGATTLFCTTASVAAISQTASAQTKNPKLDLELIEKFVRAGHSDLKETQRLLKMEPGLLNASWDWGGGDWETALGGASHMGRPDIASFLLESGARMDQFAAAMLGKLDVLQSMLKTFPAMRDSSGPHGISLLVHAKKGGADAAHVVKFLNLK